MTFIGGSPNNSLVVSQIPNFPMSKESAASDLANRYLRFISDDLQKSSGVVTKQMLDNLQAVKSLASQQGIPANMLLSSLNSINPKGSRADLENFVKTVITNAFSNRPPAYMEGQKIYTGTIPPLKNNP